MCTHRQKSKGFSRDAALLWIGGTDIFPNRNQYWGGHRVAAEYRNSASVCELRSYFISKFLYWYRDGIECGASNEKILMGGSI